MTSGCCPGLELHGWVSGRLVEFPGRSPKSLALAAVEAFDALQNPEPAHLAEAQSGADGRYQTGCIDLTLVSLRLLLLCDDPGFDGLDGDWYPVYTAVLEVNDDGDRTCSEDVPDAYAVSNPTVIGLGESMGMPDLAFDGLALVFVLDSDGNPVEGATLQLEGGGEIPGAVYPDAALLDLTGPATSPSGAVLIPGPLALTTAVPVKPGMSFTPSPVVAPAGSCFVREYRAD